MSLPRLDDLADIAGGRVLARLDLNVPLRDGAVLDDTRIVAAVPTLRWLLESAGIVAVCSHLGKPAGEPDPAFSLVPVAAALESALGRPVQFVPDCLDRPPELPLGGLRSPPELPLGELRRAEPNRSRTRPLPAAPGKRRVCR